MCPLFVILLFAVEFTSISVSVTAAINCNRDMIKEKILLSMQANITTLPDYHVPEMLCID